VVVYGDSVGELRNFAEMENVEGLESFPGVEFVYKQSKDGVDTHLLVLLHGMGDAAGNFVNFGEKLNLQHTALLAIQGIIPVPWFHEGMGWFSALDPLSGEFFPPGWPERMSTLLKTRKLLQEFLEKRVLTKWNAEQVFLLGFSQGGTMALDLALFTPHAFPVISISGTIMEEMSMTPTIVKRDFCCLVTHGEADAVVPFMEAQQRFGKMQKFFTPKDATFFKVPNKDHAMPKSAVEARQIHAFFARHQLSTLDAMAKRGSIVEIK